MKKMKRKILGTEKFVVHFFNGRNVRQNPGTNSAEAKHFLYKQWGRIFKIDENGNYIDNGYPFTNYGDMLSYINQIMIRAVKKNIKK